MRTIKFRAIDNLGATIYGVPQTTSKLHLSLDYMAQYFTSQRKYSRELVIIKPETLGQFVGFLDKKGDELYEGDIIQYDYFGDEGELQYSNMQIFWNESTASFCYDDSYKNDKTSFQELNQEFCSDIIIVGNIHQNSDLLACPQADV